MAPEPRPGGWTLAARSGNNGPPAPGPEARAVPTTLGAPSRARSGGRRGRRRTPAQRLRVKNSPRQTDAGIWLLWARPTQLAKALPKSLIPSTGASAHLTTFLAGEAHSLKVVTNTKLQRGTRRGDALSASPSRPPTPPAPSPAPAAPGATPGLARRNLLGTTPAPSAARTRNEGKSFTTNLTTRPYTSRPQQIKKREKRENF